MKRSPNCERDRGGESKDCVIGCSEDACCENSEAGTKSYLCLEQILKRLGRDMEPGDKCGSCGIIFS